MYISFFASCFLDCCSSFFCTLLIWICNNFTLNTLRICSNIRVLRILLKSKAHKATLHLFCALHIMYSISKERNVCVYTWTNRLECYEVLLMVFGVHLTHKHADRAYVATHGYITNQNSLCIERQIYVTSWKTYEFLMKLTHARIIAFSALFHFDKLMAGVYRHWENTALLQWPIQRPILVQLKQCHLKWISV